MEGWKQKGPEGAAVMSRHPGITNGTLTQDSARRVVALNDAMDQLP